MGVTYHGSRRDGRKTCARITCARRRSRHHRVAGALAGLTIASLATGHAAAQATPDVFVKYFANENVAVGGPAPIGGFTFNQATNQFWTVGFTGAFQSIRRLDPSSPTVVPTLNAANQKWTLRSATGGGGSAVTYAGPTVASADPSRTGPLFVGVGESDWNRFVRSSSLTNNGGSGTQHYDTWSGQATPGNMQFNPTTLTVGGITYAPGTLGVFTDAMNPGSGGTIADAKTVYAYDLRTPGQAQAAGARDRNGNAFVEWNEVFETIVTRQDFATANGAAATPNQGRNFAFSADNGRFIYMNDSGTGYGGVWRVDLEQKGPAALRRIVTVNAAQQMNVEPAVVHTSTRDFDAQDARAGDQIVVETSSANGPGVTSGGIAYLVHNTATNDTGPLRTLVHPTRMQNVFGLGATAADLDGIAADATAANLYFVEGSSAAVGRLDPAGRISKVAGNEQRVTFALNNAAEEASGTSLLDPQVRSVTVTNGASTFAVPEVLFSDTGFDAPLATLAFKVGDFNADNQVTAADTALFIQEFDREVSATATLPRGNANYQAYLKADLNGSARFVASTGTPSVTYNAIIADAVNDKDLLILLQHVNKLAGDANLDGTVNAADQAIVAPNVGQPGNWLDGDFDRDGTVTAADLAMVTTNLNQTYALEGFVADASYTGGAAGTWAANVRKPGGVTPADADTLVTLARAGGATVAGPTANASVAYLTVGHNVAGDAATTLQLAPNVTLATSEGAFVRPTGALTGPATATLRLGTAGHPGWLALEDGATLGGTFRLEGGLYVTNDATPVTFDGVVANHGADAPGVIKTGEGLLVLNGANTYTGPTLAHGGVLQANDGAGLPAASTLQFRSGGVLQGNGTFARTLGTAAGNFNFVSSGGGGGFAARGGTLTVNPNGGAPGADAALLWTATGFLGSNPFVLGSTSADGTVDFVDQLSLGASGTATREVRVNDNPAVATDRAKFSAPISGVATATLDKTGLGDLELAALNTYLGPTFVSGGRLFVNGSTAGGAVTVRAGATLGGRGAVNGPVTITSGGFVSAGDAAVNGGVGELDLNAGLTLSMNAVMAMQFGTLAADLIDLNGGTFAGPGGTGGVTVNVADAGGLAIGQTYTVVDFTGATLSGLEASDFALGSSPVDGVFAIQGSTLTFTTVPEPASAAWAGLAAAAGLLARRRRRRNDRRQQGGPA